VKILLDENIPESLLGALEDLGHEVDSVNHLKLKGLDNGTLYRQVAIAYDLCFTRDTGFAHNVRQMRDPSQVKVLRVVVPQQRVESFVPAFIDCFPKIRLDPLLKRRRLAVDVYYCGPFQPFHRFAPFKTFKRFNRCTQFKSLKIGPGSARAESLP
jgi:predicted nuclease of predicted toxin-antitoxin system